MSTEQKRRPPQPGRRPADAPRSGRPRRPEQTRQAPGKRIAQPPQESRRRLQPPRPPRQNTEVPEVEYTPAKPITRRRFAVQLATVAAVVLALTFCLTIFFKVETITVTGAEKYKPWTVLEASGIKKGDNLLTFGKPAACGRIRTTLPYVKSVRIGVKLPDTVNIEIVESPMAYAAEAEDSTWWLMTASGRIVEQISAEEAKKTTQVIGFRLETPVGEQAKAARPAVSEPFEGTEAVNTAASMQLETTLQILQNLEENEIIGQVSRVDVSDTGNLKLQYEDRYEVTLGDSSALEKKIRSMHLAIGQMSRYQTGYLDVSFTTWPDEVAFTPREEG